MKYLKSKEQLNDLLSSGQVILIVFVDPNEFLPAKMLLDYIYSHRTTPKTDHMLFIWKLVDQEIYDRFNVTAFPQITVMRGSQPLYSALGYNRQKANQAIQLLCRQSGLGRLTKQLNENLSSCPNGHPLDIPDTAKQSQYVGGCYNCSRCNLWYHFEKERPSLHCEFCPFNVCPVCSYSDVLV